MSSNIQYTCPRCSYSTIVKGNLIAHLKNKKICNATLVDISRDDILKTYQKKNKNETIECSHCSKVISKQNMARHMKTCKNKPLPVNDKLIIGMQQEIENLKSEIASLKTSPQTIQNIIYNSATINIQNNINNFGNEDLTHLTHEFLSHCLLNPTKGFPSLIDTIHYNPDVPHNHNLRFKSTKKQSFEKYVNEHWMECDASNTLDELIRKGYKILNSHYMEHFMNSPEYIENEMKQRALERFRFLNDKNSNEYHSIKRELRMLVKDRTIYILESPEHNANTLQ
jgi:hypothetical protein